MTESSVWGDPANTQLMRAGVQHGPEIFSVKTESGEQKFNRAEASYWDTRQLGFKKSRLLQQSKAILDAAEQAGTDLSEDQQARFENILSAVEQIDADLRFAQNYNQGVMDAVAKNPNTKWVGHGQFSDNLESPAIPHIGASYADLFGRSAGGFDSFADFVSPMRTGLFDVRYAANQREGSPADGGFAVPTEFSAAIMDAASEFDFIRPLAMVWPMASATRKVPAWSNLDQTDGKQFGGLNLQWLAEGGDIPLQNAKMRLIELVAKKAGLLASVSNELADDGVGFAAQLEVALSRAAGYGLLSAWLFGTGAGQPLGMLNSPATVTVAKENGQAAGSVLYANLTSMYSRLHPASLATAIWVANSQLSKPLLEMTIPIGTGGSHIPLLREGSNGSFSIFGIPVRFTPVMKAIGQQGDIALVDPRQYAIGMRRDFMLDRSGHVGFTKDETYFRGLLRVDGQPVWDKPMKPQNGATLSPFVTLAARG